MSNVWSCADYEILKVEQSADQEQYRITIQRLPQNTYPDYTVYNFSANEADENNEILFPANLALNDLIANAIPSVNSFIASVTATSYTIIS